MNSLSEHKDRGPVKVPVRFLNTASRGKAASRLEFHAVGRQDAEREEASAEIWVDAEARLSEQLAALEAKLLQQAEEASTQIDEARRDARLNARMEWEQELNERVALERDSVLKLVEQFTKEKARYFAGVEAEIVKLTLAIAGRVLHREVQLDPLLLKATARVALEKIAEDSEAVLRVPEADVSAWREALDSAPRSVQLVGDERLHPGDCVLETSIGRVELGVSAQLAEIEKGFFDLLQMRPV